MSRSQLLAANCIAALVLTAGTTLAQFTTLPSSTSCSFVSSNQTWPLGLVALAPNGQSTSTIVPSSALVPVYRELMSDSNTENQSASVAGPLSPIPQPMVMLSDTGTLIYKVRNWQDIESVQPIFPDSNPPLPVGDPIPQRERILAIKLDANVLLNNGARDDLVILDNRPVLGRNLFQNAGGVFGEIFYYSNFRFFALGDEISIMVSIPDRVRHFCRGGEFVCDDVNLSRSQNEFITDLYSYRSACGLQLARGGAAASMYNLVLQPNQQQFPGIATANGCEFPGPCGFGMELVAGTIQSFDIQYIACISTEGQLVSTRILSRSIFDGEQTQVPDRGLSVMYSGVYDYMATPAFQGVVSYGVETNSAQSIFENGVYLCRPHVFTSPPQDSEGAIRMIYDGLTARDVSQGFFGSGGPVTVDMSNEPGVRYQGRLSATRDGSILAVTDFDGNSGIPGQSFIREAVVARLLQWEFPDDVVSYIRTGQKLPLPSEVFVADANWTPPASGPQDATGVFLRARDVILRPDRSVVLYGEYYQDFVANNQPDLSDVRLGVWLYTTADGWQPIAVAGQYAVDGGNVLGRYAITDAASTTITANAERGEIVYSAQYFSPSDNDNRGAIFYHSNACDVTRVVMKTGDSYTLPNNGPTGIVGALTLVGGNNGEDGRPQTFNNRGQLAFSAAIKFSAGQTTETYDAIFVTSANPAPAACGDIDFNNNGVFPEDEDVNDFFAVLAGSTPATCDPVLGCDDIDINNNDVFPEDADVICFFNLLAGGNCDGACN